MTNTNKKQLKITKLFRKQDPLPEDCEELEEEIKQLERKVKDKQNELFQVQRNSYKRKVAPNKTKTDKFVRPEKIIFQNNITHLEKNMELMSMLTGMEVKSYVANDHCVVVYHMQHPSTHEVQHGLRINMKSGTNLVSKFSLPLGFNFNAVVEEFENIMTAECLGSIRKALVAYYDRQQQFQELKTLLNIEAQLFKIMDGTHIEVAFKVQADDDEEDIDVVLMLDYRVYDIRPKQYSLKEIDLPEGVADVLKEQCAVFKKKPLNLAFKDCFLSGNGPYTFVHQVERPEREQQQPVRRRRHRKPQPYQHNNDETFRPEDCSASSEEEEDDERVLRERYGRP